MDSEGRRYILPSASQAPGFPATPIEVIAALTRYGISMNKELIRAVAFEMRKEMARADEERR